MSAEAAEGRAAKVLRYIAANLTRDLSVPILAEAAGLSERTLLRVFREELETTPAEYVQRMRVDAARRRLAAARVPVARVAAACGFANPETMRRAFQRALGVSPADYRARFATAQRQSH
jgi:transcriptional regulator GlxA family with amidase domain